MEKSESDQVQKERTDAWSLLLPAVGVIGSLFTVGTCWLAWGTAKASPWLMLLLGLGATSLLLSYLADRKRAEEVLAASETRYRTLVETMNDGLAAADEHGRVTYVNQRYCDMLGYSADELIGQGAIAIFDDESRRRYEEQRARRRAGERGQYELDLRRKDGARVTVVISAQPIYDKDGVFRGSFATHTDISERKRAEEALARSEERYRNLVEAMNDGVSVRDEAGRFVYANRRFCEMFGYTTEELAELTAVDLAPEENRETLRTWMASRRAPEDGPHELVWQRKNGERFRALSFPHAIYDSAGNLRGSFGITRELTGAERADGQQADEDERYRRVVEEQMELICRFRPDCTLTFVNEAFCRFFGKTRDDLIGHNVLPFIPAEERDMVRQLPGQLSAENPTKTHDQRIITPQGEARWHQWSGKALFDQQDRVVEIQGVARDITVRKQMEEELHVLSTELLLGQDRERKRLAHLLHEEFGQLLAATKMTAERLQQKLPAERSDLNEIAEQLSCELAQAIENMQVMQRNLHPPLIDHLGLDSAIEVLVAEFEEQSGISCDLDMGPDPLDINEEQRLAVYRIVQEALANVAKHAEAAEVQVRLRQDGCRLQVEVWDDGCGINPGSASVVDAHGLSGMRARAEYFGGRLDIHAMPTGGTLLTAEIPLGPSQTAAVARTKAA